MLLDYVWVGTMGGGVLCYLDYKQKKTKKPQHTLNNVWKTKHPIQKKFLRTKKPASTEKSTKSKKKGNTNKNFRGLKPLPEG
ncbi:hypothetical protein [Staphylococcus aureus]|uniref:hypothetical protein n=1 Tax=Staphylococcus aureus TaxID=1280 RepID=UPI00165276A1|nr:hypothetical protein [Staphylococcus aureus]